MKKILGFLITIVGIGMMFLDYFGIDRGIAFPVACLGLGTFIFGVLLMLSENEKKDNSNDFYELDK